MPLKYEKYKVAVHIKLFNLITKIKPMKKILFLLVLSFFTINTFAQLVNVEKRRKDKKEGLQGVIKFSGSLNKNTSIITQLNNNVQLQYYKKQNTLLLFNDITFMQIDDSVYINKGFQHLRYNYSFANERITWEVFGQNQYNSIRLLKHRVLGGTGPRFKIAGNDSSSFSLHIGLLSMFEYELLTDDSTDSHEIKGDFYLTTNYAFNETFSIGHTTYYQPHYSKWSDFRIASETLLAIKINKFFAINFIYHILYDAIPPEDIPEVYSNFRTALKISF